MENGYIEQVQASVSLLTSKEQMLGKGLNIPNNATNSGSRKIMNGTHQSHSLVLSHGEVPYVGTGYENRFGDESSSIIETGDDELEVVAKISKFSYAPNHHYWLILRNYRTNELSVLERVSYKYKTESYGYLHNNSLMDSYSVPGTIIHSNTVLRRSTGFDQFGNKTNGRNCNIAYLALDNNMEDSVIISSKCSEELSAPLIRSVKIVINENDIPLNIYGNDELYKVHPDIGEDVKDGILMAYRREKREEAIYTQSVQRLQQIMMSDSKITIKGKVIDINIYCNNPEYIQSNTYNQQFLAYYRDRLRCDTELINAVGPYMSQGCTLSYELAKMFSMAKAELSGKKYIDKNKFSNVTIEFVVMENRKLGVGDKVSDRYGGKGVVSKIVPTELMPLMPNGQHVDMIKNSSTMYNRENAGQIFELEINYISMRILDRIRSDPNMTPDEAMTHILEFIKIQSYEEYKDLLSYINTLDRQNFLFFLESMLDKTCIMISNEPISETMTIDKLGELYNAFPWVRPVPIKVPMKDSNGNYRFVNTRRPLIVAPQYCIRLKQFAEEKFSATSLSSTNLRNENSKSKASKNHREPNSRTPVRFGYMETGDLIHMGAEYMLINLLILSLSPHARRLIEQISTGDPYDIDVKIDSKSKNRSAEILNSRLKTMGYRMVFKKIEKIKRYGIMTPGLLFDNNSNGMQEAVEFLPDDYDFDHYNKTMEEVRQIRKSLAVRFEALSFTEKNDDKFLIPKPKEENE